MTYFILDNSFGKQKWEPINYIPTNSNAIKLYNDDLQFIGIGYY